MKKLRISIAYVLLICLFTTVSSCSQKKEETKPAPKDQFEAVQPIIEEVEGGLIAVMSRADVIPYYEKQFAAKKKHKEEQQAKAEAQATAQGQQGSQPPAGQQATKPEEFKPEPLTINDVLLSEVLKKEVPKDEEEMTKKAEKIPETIELVWQEITSTISTLHEQWNELSTKLKELNVSATAMTNFENALNELTIAATEKKYMETLMSANKTSGYISEFMEESKEAALPPLYQMKYLVRQIVLDSANNDYVKANEHLQALKSQEDLLAPKLAEKKAEDEASKLKTSIAELEKALKVKDLNLIKVEAAVMSKNLAAIKEALKG